MQPLQTVKKVPLIVDKNFLRNRNLEQEAAFARRRVIDPRAQSRRGHSRATTPQWGVRRRRKWQVNVKAKIVFSPGPPLVLGRLVARLLMQGGSGCRGFL